jgi:small subunit ribosomal protein S18
MAEKKRFPATDENTTFDYKNPQLLRHYLTDRGKIVPARVSGLTAQQQRALTEAIKRARVLALLPYSVK